MSETCLENSQLTLLIFGSIFGTLSLCFGFIFVLWYFAKTRPNFRGYFLFN